jgi:hypothetical protein
MSGNARRSGYVDQDPQFETVVILIVSVLSASAGIIRGQGKATRFNGGEQPDCMQRHRKVPVRSACSL